MAVGVRVEARCCGLAGSLKYYCRVVVPFFFFSSRRRHTRFDCDWSSDVCSSDLEIWCIAVNDAFVMGAWGKEQGAKNKVRMMADGSAAYTKALGLEFDLTARGKIGRAHV